MCAVMPLDRKLRQVNTGPSPPSETRSGGAEGNIDQQGECRICDNTQPVLDIVSSAY